MFGFFNVDIMMKSGSVVGSGGCRVPILGEGGGGSGASFLRKQNPRYLFEGFANNSLKKYLAYF